MVKLKYMKKDYKYKAFLSYSHRDKAFAKWLHRRIENYKIPLSLRKKYPNLPKDLKRTIFRDEEELPTASELSDNLLNALDNSEKLIVVCSPNSVSSLWVNSEIAYFKQKHGENSVLAIIKSGEPNATYMNDENNEAFPKALRYKVAEDQTLTDERTEPIAGDARSYFDKEMALMKMIAGILKVDFADLWRREKREQTKRRVIFMAILTVFIALAFYTSTQFIGNKINVELEKITNKIAKIEYSIRHDEFSLKERIDLNEELKKLKKLKKDKESTQETLGQLKTSFGHKVQVAYTNEGAEAAIKILTSRNNLARKEQLKKELSLEDITLAKLYTETHQYDKAQKSYEDAIHMFFDYENAITYGYFLINQNQFNRAIIIHEKLLKKDLALHDKVTVLRRLATLYKKTNDINKSKTLYKKAIKISKSLFENKLDINDENYIKTLGSLAVLYRNSKRFVESEKAYSEALRIVKILVAKNPYQYNLNLAITLSSSAVLYKRINNYQESEKRYLKASSLLRNLTEENFDKYGGSLAITLSSLSSLYKRMHRYNESKKNYIESLKISEKLVKINPNKYGSSYAITLSSLADLYKNMKQYDKSEEKYLKASLIFKELVQRHPNVYINNLIITLNGLAMLYQDTGRLTLAKKISLEEVHLLKKVLKSHDNKDKIYLNQTLNKLLVITKVLNSKKK